MMKMKFIAKVSLSFSTWLSIHDSAKIGESPTNERCFAPCPMLICHVFLGLSMCTYCQKPVFIFLFWEEGHGLCKLCILVTKQKTMPSLNQNIRQSLASAFVWEKVLMIFERKEIRKGTLQ